MRSGPCHRCCCERIVINEPSWESYTDCGQILADERPRMVRFFVCVFVLGLGEFGHVISLRTTTKHKKIESAQSRWVGAVTEMRYSITSTGIGRTNCVANLFSIISLRIVRAEPFQAPNTKDKYMNKVSRNLAIYSDEATGTALCADADSKMTSQCCVSVRWRRVTRHTALEIFKFWEQPKL